MTMTRSQHKGHAHQKAKADANFRRLRDMCDEGATKEEAARRIGMTVNGVNNMLYTRLGSSVWPFDTERSA